MIYVDLVVSDKLWNYLADMEEQAQSRLEVLIQQMKETESITEELKAGE